LPERRDRCSGGSSAALSGVGEWIFKTPTADRDDGYAMNDGIAVHADQSGAP